MTSVWIVEYEKQEDEGLEYRLVKICVNEEKANEYLRKIIVLHYQYQLFTDNWWGFSYKEEDEVKENFRNIFNEICNNSEAEYDSIEHYFIKEVKLYE